MKSYTENAKEKPWSAIENSLAVRQLERVGSRLVEEMSELVQPDLGHSSRVPEEGQRTHSHSLGSTLALTSRKVVSNIWKKTYTVELPATLAFGQDFKNLQHLKLLHMKSNIMRYSRVVIRSEHWPLATQPLTRPCGGRVT